jgi:hypothetical protein
VRDCLTRRGSQGPRLRGVLVGSIRIVPLAHERDRVVWLPVNEPRIGGRTHEETAIGPSPKSREPDSKVTVARETQQAKQDFPSGWTEEGTKSDESVRQK